MAKLSVSRRQAVGKDVGKIRNSGLVPGVVYGHGVATQAVAVEKQAFEKVYREVGESTLFDLVVEGQEPVKVLVQEVQKHSTTGQVLHVDFHQIRMDEKVNVEVPLKFVGEPKAVKELGGILVKNLSYLTIECLPQDLIREIEVDISNLSEFGQGLSIKDINLPVGLKVIGNPDELVVVVNEARSETELESLKQEVKEDVTQVERVEKKEKEETTEPAVK